MWNSIFKMQQLYQGDKVYSCINVERMRSEDHKNVAPADGLNSQAMRWSSKIWYLLHWYIVEILHFTFLVIIFQPNLGKPHQTFSGILNAELAQETLWGSHHCKNIVLVSRIVDAFGTSAALDFTIITILLRLGFYEWFPQYGLWRNWSSRNPVRKDLQL